MAGPTPLARNPASILDFLTVDDAADLSSQVPLLFRGVFFKGWKSAKILATHRSIDDFLDRVTPTFAHSPLFEPDVAAAAVFSLLRRQISPGEYQQVVWAMRKSLRVLWM